jgi:hypothetical protein
LTSQPTGKTVLGARSPKASVGGRQCARSWLGRRRWPRCSS